MNKLIILILFLCLSANACSAELSKKVVVFAAASLTDAITAIAESYEKESHIEIQTSFASSSTLAKQIENGAPADIFISADSKWVQYLKDKNDPILKCCGTIVFIRRCTQYAMGHYLVRVKGGWMNPWVNCPEMIPVKAGLVRKLPAQPED